MSNALLRVEGLVKSYGTRRAVDAVQSLVAAYARTLSERYWGATRRLFWRVWSYSRNWIRARRCRGFAARSFICSAGRTRWFRRKRPAHCSRYCRISKLV